MDEFRRRHTDADPESSFEECPRFHTPHELTDEQIEAIAEKAADRAVEKAKTEMYNGIGKSVVRGLYYLVGVVAVGLFVFAVQRGWVKPQ